VNQVIISLHGECQGVEGKSKAKSQVENGIHLFVFRTSGVATTATNLRMLLEVGRQPQPTPPACIQPHHNYKQLSMQKCGEAGGQEGGAFGDQNVTSDAAKKSKAVSCARRKMKVIDVC
jgi:hypothetical protein